MIAATLWAMTARLWPRVILLAAVAAAFSLLTPLVRASTVLAWLPDWLEWYIRPPQGRSWFTLFPWAGLLVAGTIAGEVLDRARSQHDERRALVGLAVGGAALFAVSLGASFLPSLYANTYFWTTGPSYFFLRIGLMTALLPMAALWTRRLAPDRFSPMLQFGQTSLFIYWIHVEMVYGILSWPLHRALPFGAALVAFTVFTGLMLWASLVKERVVAWWRRSSHRSLAASEGG
jgi:uncharacterized membrane protein